MAFNAAKHTATNKSIATLGKPVDAKAYYYDDGGTFLYRVFLSWNEVNAYFNTPDSRKGHSLIVINTGGTLNAGIVTGGTNDIWYYKDGLADNNLVRLIPSVDLSNYFTKSEINSLLANKVDKTITINNKSLNANVLLTKVDIGLPAVDNTSDLNKPISIATQAALNDIISQLRESFTETLAIDYDGINHTFDLAFTPKEPGFAFFKNQSPLNIFSDYDLIGATVVISPDAFPSNSVGGDTLIFTVQYFK